MKKFSQFDAFGKSGSDILAEKYAKPEALKEAQSLLSQEEISEEAFLGAQGVLLLHGLI